MWLVSCPAPHRGHGELVVRRFRLAELAELGLVRRRFGLHWAAVVRVESRHERPQARRGSGYYGIAQLYLRANRRQDALKSRVIGGKLGSKVMEPKQCGRDDARVSSTCRKFY